MAVLPDWLLGRGITTIQVTPQEFSGGMLLPPVGATTVDFFTVVDGIELDFDVEQLEVSPTRSRQKNMVILSTGATFTLTEILRRNPGVPGTSAFNSLAALFMAYDYFLLVFTRAGRSFRFYAVNSGYRERIARGKCTGEARFGPVGTVEAGALVTRNPSYS